MATEFDALQTSSLSPDFIKEYVLPQFGLENAEISVIKFKDTDKQRAVYKISTDQKDYCLKKVYYELPDLLYVYSALEWLYRNGIRVPKLLPTVDNNRFAKFDNMYFILNDWVEGEKCSFDNIQHVEISIKKLAEMHNVSRNFQPILGSSSKKGLDNYYISTQKHFYDLLRNSNNSFRCKDKFSKKYIAEFDTALDLATISLEMANKIKPEELSISLCHGDYVNKNILMPDDLNPWIIDFDKCKTDYCAKDLSYFLRRILKRENTNWDADLFMDILNCYTEVAPLTKSDLYYIMAYTAFPQKYWKISRDYFKNIRKCNKSSFMTLLNSATSKLENQYNFACSMVKKLNL